MTSKQPGGLNLKDLDFPGHPGGQKLLDMARHSKFSNLLFLSYHLGKDFNAITAAATTLGVSVPEKTALYTALNQATKSIVENSSVHLKIYELYCLCLTLALPFAYYAFVFEGLVTGALLFGALLVSYAFVIFHTRHHRGQRVYSNNRLNRTLKPLYDVFDETFMVQPGAWRDQHQASHHLHANHPEHDYDVYHPFPYLRLNADQPHRPWHVWQSFYAPVLLLLNAFTFPLTNVTARGGKIRYLVLNLSSVVLLPILLHGWQGLVLYLVALSPASILISYLFQVSHNFQELNQRTHSSAEIDDADFDSWFDVQVTQSTDYGGYLMTLIFGGINLQASHHVAPGLPPPYLYFLSNRIQSIAAERGIHHVRQPHFLTALVSYHRRLGYLAVAPERR